MSAYTYCFPLTTRSLQHLDLPAVYSIKGHAGRTDGEVNAGADKTNRQFGCLWLQLLSSRMVDFKPPIATLCCYSWHHLHQTHPILATSARPFSLPGPASRLEAPNCKANELQWHIENIGVLGAFQYRLKRESDCSVQCDIGYWSSDPDIQHIHKFHGQLSQHQSEIRRWKIKQL